MIPNRRQISDNRTQIIDSLVMLQMPLYKMTELEHGPI